MNADKYQVIIVGGGLSGLAAAYKLAQSGMEVVLIERGDYCGSKNLSGGVFYSRIMDKLIPSFWEEAPIERYITNYYTTLTTRDGYVNLEYKSKNLVSKPYNAVTVLRAKFDRWLAEKAEEAGAMIVTGIKVDKLLKEGNRIIGIRAGDEEMLADVIISADGINSFLAREAGLREPIKNEHLAVGVKTLIELPREIIEERFKLNGTEGAAFSILGEATQGVAGGAFFYTNLESVSLGVVMRLDALLEERVKASDVIDNLLVHPMIEPYLKGGKIVEYGAHLTAEGGLKMVPSKLCADGLIIIGDAAGLTINSGLVIRGMDLAVGSGLAAASTIIEAREKEDYSSKMLNSYLRHLKENSFWQDLKLYAKAPEFMESERLYKKYSLFAGNLFKNLYTHDLAPKERLFKSLLKSLEQSGISVWDLIKDGYKGVRAL